jgi:hypothetical protein
MSTNKKPKQKTSDLDRIRFKLRPNVYYEDVPWFREEGVFSGTRVNRRGTIRLYAPDGAPEPRFIDVEPYWVTLSKD